MTRDYSDIPPEELLRFHSFFRKSARCWIWKGGFDGATPTFYYVSTSGKRRQVVAVRLNLFLAGKTAPKGGLHKQCNRIQCCNPYHVYQTKPIELPPEPEYNAPQRNKFSLSLDGDNFLATLAPLRHDRSVSISMEVPRPASHRKGLSDTKRSLLILVPGRLAGIDPLGVLVAVVGSGSCVVWPLAPPKVANLVLAGMPVKLANVLMDKLRQTLLEK